MNDKSMRANESRDAEGSIHSYESPEDPSPSSEASSDQDEDVRRGAYTSLLQDLHAHHSRSERGNKRRKLAFDSASDQHPEAEAVKGQTATLNDHLNERFQVPETDASDVAPVNDLIEGDAEELG